MYVHDQVDKLDVKLREEIQTQMDDDEDALIRHTNKLRKNKKARDFRARRVINRDIRYAGYAIIFAR